MQKKYLTHTNTDTGSAGSNYNNYRKHKMAFIGTSPNNFLYEGLTTKNYVEAGTNGYGGYGKGWRTKDNVQVPHGKGTITDFQTQKVYACRYKNGELQWLAERDNYEERLKNFGIRKMFCMNPVDPAGKVRRPKSDKNWSLYNAVKSLKAIGSKSNNEPAPPAKSFASAVKLTPKNINVLNLSSVSDTDTNFTEENKGNINSRIMQHTTKPSKNLFSR